ncbi:VanZ family protein [Galactobacillus timonensis]|uniref:VanZ family protein n=2 Tax=Galactobacillus timonensis TaxID=2041840 RepID=UPI002409B9FC|nr:VanZ family protein [Galactobacillus timonensis]
MEATKMRDILKIVPVLPLAALVAAEIYALACRFRKGGFSKLTKRQMIAEYLLTGWFVMFIYVTQIMPFGNGMGERYNLRPLRIFYVACRYGLTNAAGVWQFLLNIVMFVPLGILFPLVFSKFRCWRKMTSVSFFLSLATELLQLISYRGTDIDDVIANTVGGMCGFALSILLDRDRVRRSSNGSIAVSVTVLCLTALPFVGVQLVDGTGKYGNLYYGHLIPASIDVQCNTDDQEEVRNVYQYEEKTDLETLKKQLQKDSGIQGIWTGDDGEGAVAQLNGSDDACIFIYPYHTWMVRYGRYASINETLTKQQLLERAWDGLRRLDIDDSTVSFAKDDSDAYGDGGVHLLFESTESNDTIIVNGAVEVTLMMDGSVTEIDDHRIWCRRVDRVPCISSANSLSVAKDVGVGHWSGKAIVKSVTRDYAFISETGFLIPAWKIQGYLVSSDGTQFDWDPEIDAMK